jgi:hypothetical protein
MHQHIGELYMLSSARSVLQGDKLKEDDDSLDISENV